MTTTTTTSPPRRHPPRRIAAATLAGAALLAAITGCEGLRHPERYGEDAAPMPEVTASSVEVTKAQFGHTWPLNIDHGTITCKDSEQVIFTAPDGAEYGLNRRALDAGYADPAPLQPSDDKISMGPLFSYGLQTCQH